jgi:sigma-B regulation protein RsbU (phosphoserine phosphatase)
MFITVWIGTLEVSTGKMICANAGHEYPVLKRADGKFELFKDKHGFVIGGMDGLKYKEYELNLNPGDKLFVYTDGVPEAMDKDLALFGIDRMVDALNTDPDAPPRQMLRNVRNAVDDFVRDAEQFDDLTMLGFEYRGPVK